MSDTYSAEIDRPSGDTRSRCGACGWAGRFNALQAIGACALTPGDPSPAGRCPACESLAYVEVVPDWMGAGNDYWDEDARFPVADWQYEVANEDTRHGYWAWVRLRAQEAADALPSSDELRRRLAEDDAESLMSHARAGDRDELVAFILSPPVYDHMEFDELADLARNRGLIDGPEVGDEGAP